MLPDSIPLAMLNALAFCERRFVYEFVQGEMLVNHHVREGELRHGPRAHQPGTEQGGRVQRSMPLYSARRRVYGVVDFVEEQPPLEAPVAAIRGEVARLRMAGEQVRLFLVIFLRQVPQLVAEQFPRELLAEGVGDALVEALQFARVDAALGSGTTRGDAG